MPNLQTGNIPLILCASHEEGRHAEADLTVSLVESIDQRESAPGDRAYIAPAIKERSQSLVAAYIELFNALLEEVRGLTGEETLLLLSPHGIARGPAFGIGLRAHLYGGDTALAVTGQVAQRPQCQPSPFIVQIADQILGLEGALCRALNEYLVTGMAISSTGQTFHYDPEGVGEDPEENEVQEERLEKD